VRVRVYPISVDVAEFEEVGRSAAVRAEEARMFAERPERIVLRVDRTDPSKNIVRGFQAFGLFLEQHPEWRGRVRLLALLDPSRLDIPEYVEYLARLERAAADVGERFRDADGVSAVDLRIHDNFSEVVAGYRQYDVLLELNAAPGRRLRMQQLSDRVVLSRSRVSRVVDEMEQAGLVRREPDPDDRRASFAVITDDGRAALRKAAPVYLQGIDDEFLSHLGAGERKALERSLRKVLDAQRGEVEAAGP